jgi:hypothetical protein
MNPETRVLINLASRPARNRRLFLSACGFSAALIAVFLFLSGSAWMNYGVKKRSLRGQAAETERLSREARSEESRLETQIQSAEKALGTKVRIINSIILRKTFSWTDLFARLEESLPDPSFITSLAPSYGDDSTLFLKIQVVSRNLDDLVRLINNLMAKGFRDIHVTNESTDPRGRNLAEISLTYERIL